MEQKNKITKCLKSYLTGKKYFDKDNEKSFEYFKQCIRLMDEMKTSNMINEEYKDVIEETEIECSKYLTLTIENTIDKPFIKQNKVRDIDTNDSNILFQLIEMGKLDEIKKYKYGDVNFKIYNNGLSPLHFAINFGDTSTLKHFLKIGGPIDITNEYGHTLLEYACLENDPNLIEFLYYYGADMKKHLVFREGKKYFNNSNMIDIALLEKIVMEVDKPNTPLKYLEHIKGMIDMTELLDIQYENSSENKITIADLIGRLDKLLECMNKDARSSYIDIIKEELSFDLINKLGCPSNKVEIILYNLVPFIGYTETLKLNWLIALEIKYILIKILKNKKRINIKELKEELNNILNESYLKSKIIPKGLIDIIVLQWINKINV